MTDTGTLDRDMIDTSGHPANPAEAHLQFVRDLILARCPEIDAGTIAGTIADAFRGDSGAWNPADDEQPDAGAIWTEVMERMCDALGELEARLEALEASLRPAN
jgi:hypothetical protein